jgi:hypothetical protein
MAQTNYTPISLYYSTTASAVPTAANLVPGELAINTNDGKLYYEDSSGVVRVLASKSTGSIGGSTTQVQFNNSGSLGGSSGLTWDGSFLTTSSIKNSALTSGRVTYAGTSGLLQDSANLTFDGTMVSAPVARFGTYTAFGTESLQVAKANGTGVVGSAYQFAINSKAANNRAEMIMTDGSTANAFISYAPNGTAASDRLTFNLQGSDILNVVGNGCVGIGLTNPVAKLTVLGTAGALTDVATIEPLYINAPTDTVGSGAGIRFNALTATKTAVGVIGVVNNATGGLGSITFHVYNNGADIPEWMRIANNGIVTMSAYGAGAATFSAAGVISSVSDETWKTKDGVPTNTDAMLQKLEPGYWFYNEEKAPTFGQDRQLGFYAQNVHEAIGSEAAPTPEEGKPWGYYDRSV